MNPWNEFVKAVRKAADIKATLFKKDHQIVLEVWQGNFLFSTTKFPEALKLAEASYQDEANELGEAAWQMVTDRFVDYLLDDFEYFEFSGFHTVDDLEVGDKRMPLVSQTIHTDREVAKALLAEGVAKHVATRLDWDQMSKEDAVVAAIRALTDDIGAAQTFLNVMGIRVNLYEEPNAVNAAPNRGSEKT